MKCLFQHRHRTVKEGILYLFSFRVTHWSCAVPLEFTHIQIILDFPKSFEGLAIYADLSVIHVRYAVLKFFALTLCTAAAAIDQLTKVLACEWAKFGVRCNSVKPTYIKTALTEVSLLTSTFQSVTNWLCSSLLDMYAYWLCFIYLCTWTSI